MNKNIIDSLTFELSVLEPLPQKPVALPSNAPHLLEFLSKNNNKRARVTLNKQIQNNTSDIVNNHSVYLQFNEINNAAALVIDNQSNKVIAYVGNSNSNKLINEGHHVDIIRSQRSTGSTLKPFLFASILNEGTRLPHSLIEDTPIKISGYSPQNFNKKFDGAVPMSNALVRSLNVPSVLMLKEYGLEKFYNKLQQLGFKSINKSPDYYGLTLILGGAESSLWEIARAYKNIAQKLTNKTTNDSPSIISNEEHPICDKHIPLSKYSIYETFDCLTEVKRPLTEGLWKEFSFLPKK